MAALPALLIGGGLLTLALVIMICRGELDAARLLIVSIIAIVAGGASAFFAPGDIRIEAVALNAFVFFGAIALLAAMLPRRAHRQAARIPGGMVLVRICVGILLLILGVIGGFIPILQGWIFILLGILVLFPKAKFTEKILHKAQARMPRMVAFLRRLGIGHDETPT